MAFSRRIPVGCPDAARSISPPSGGDRSRGPPDTRRAARGWLRRPRCDRASRRAPRQTVPAPHTRGHSRTRSTSAVLLEGVLPKERHELHRLDGDARDAIALVKDGELLHIAVADRRDDPSAFGALRHERLWQFRCGGGDENAFVRGARRIAGAAVADDEKHVADPDPRKTLERVFGELRVAFDRDDLAGE